MQPKIKKINFQNRKKKSSYFLQLTMKMIDENHPSPAVRWSNTGDSFIIESNEEFFKLLPKYFKTKNYSSFVR